LRRPLTWSAGAKDVVRAIDHVPGGDPGAGGTALISSGATASSAAVRAAALPAAGGYEPGIAPTPQHVWTSPRCALATSAEFSTVGDTMKSSS
jgi:hypothetical protein